MGHYMQSLDHAKFGSKGKAKSLNENKINRPYVIACIPAYNESENISNIVHKAKKYVDQVIVYDDGSVDGTYELATSAGATVIRNPRNNGYGTAIKELFMVARQKDADVMITIDSDGQHD